MRAVAFIVSGLLCATVAVAEARPFFAGGDVSMLPEIEKFGGVFRRADGSAGDAIAIVRENGCNLFRVRLFVKPTIDFSKSHGATQDLEYVTALARRIRERARGATFLLDIHYSDTWADPAKQFKPAAWKDLDFDALEKRVHDYTADVLKHLADAGATPDMVQVGNEIAGGMLWPDGKVLDAKGDAEAAQWKRFARLFAAGSRAVREAAKAEHPIRVVLHIHGGGKPGLPKWFFGKFDAAAGGAGDYDVVALSFYPAWGDDLDALKKNLADVAAMKKDVLVAETSYPWRAMEGVKNESAMRWPLTREGQARFVRELTEVLRTAPERRGIGFVWWYPEAIPVTGQRIWRGGAEALFDETGQALPAMTVFAEATRETPR